MFVTSYSVTYCLYVPGNWQFVFVIIVQFMMSANSRIRLHCRSYSFVCTVHHLIIIIVQNNLKTLNLENACQIYFVECVRLGTFSQLTIIQSIIQYVGLCVFSLPTPLVMIERIYIYIYIYTLSYYHHQIGSMNITHCLGLGHETMVCAVCLSIFLKFP